MLFDSMDNPHNYWCYPNGYRRWYTNT